MTTPQTTPPSTPDGPTPSVSLLDPFTVLGLSPTPDLTDDQVHDAWRRQLAAMDADRATDRGSDTGDSSGGG